MRLAMALALVVLSAHASLAADVALLKSSDVPAWRPAIEALRRAAGGHTFTEYDLRGDRAMADSVLAGFRGRPMILVAFGNLAAQAARAALPDTPLVFAMVQDPARIGLVPGPGVTGVAYGIPVKNQIAAFRSVNPRGARIGVLFHPDNSGKQVEEAEKAAALLRVAIVPKPVATVAEVPSALRALLSGDTVDAIWMPADALLIADETRRFILTEATKAGKPVYAFSASVVAEGALVSNGPDFASVGQQAGDLVNRLAAGDKTKIEVQVPRAELVINGRVGNRLKVPIPPETLKAAGKVL